MNIPAYTGIGRETAKMLAKCGAEVFALSRTQEDLDSLKKEVGTFMKLRYQDQLA